MEAERTPAGKGEAPKFRKKVGFLLAGILLWTLPLSGGRGAPAGKTFQGPGPEAGNGRWRRVRVREVRGDGRILCADGSSLRLQGVGWPRGPEVSRAAARRLRDLSIGKELRFRPVEPDPDEAGTIRGVLAPEEGGPSLARTLLGEGLVWYRTRGKKLAEDEALRGACRRAREEGRGLWAGVRREKGPAPWMRGGVLGLYYKEERFDYHRQLGRIRKIGADWVLLLLTLFVDRVDSSDIERDPRMTVSDARLRETIAHARGLGLEPALMPVVLIRHPGEDDWRGTLAPKDPGRFWSEYDEWMQHYLDLARETGVRVFFLGSELCSLEKHAGVWPRLIANARGRYGGWLGYSVNWDHYTVPSFWDELDLAGMTAYFELTEDKDADLPKLVEGWRRVRKELKGASREIGKPILLTELGYPSQDGANTAPWNYFLAKDRLDLEEQADCFRAFAEVMADAPFLSGVFIFDFFEEGGAEDHSYAIFGKPAWGVVKDLFSRLRGRRIPPRFRRVDGKAGVEPGRSGR